MQIIISDKKICVFFSVNAGSRTFNKNRLSKNLRRVSFKLKVARIYSNQLKNKLVTHKINKTTREYSKKSKVDPKHSPT